MAKGSGTTRVSSPATPEGLTSGSKGAPIDLRDIYTSAGMLDFDYSVAPKLYESDFKNEDQYYVSTDPIELKMNVAKIEDFWNRGLTGGESGEMLRAAKDEIIKAIKSDNGTELDRRDISWDKDLQEFVAYHPVSRPGDIAKSFWQIDSMKSDVVFRKEKRREGISKYVHAADKRGHDLAGAYAMLDYKIKMKSTGWKEY